MTVDERAKSRRTSATVQSRSPARHRRPTVPAMPRYPQIGGAVGDLWGVLMATGGHVYSPPVSGSAWQFTCGDDRNRKLERRPMFLSGCRPGGVEVREPRENRNKAPACAQLYEAFHRFKDLAPLRKNVVDTRHRSNCIRRHYADGPTEYKLAKLSGTFVHVAPELIAANRFIETTGSFCPPASL